MFSSSALAAVIVDDFEDASSKVGGKASTYVMAPSRALAVKSESGAHEGAKGLMLKYDKRAEGGPDDAGGWCGYYTLLKNGSNYLDASGFKTVSFWVKGAEGNENFVVGVADRHWHDVGDSVKSEPIGKYLPEGRITTAWQKATVPLSTFSVEMKELASLAICFEWSAFPPSGAGKGTLFLDDITFE